MYEYGGMAGGAGGAGGFGGAGSWQMYVKIAKVIHNSISDWRSATYQSRIADYNKDIAKTSAEDVRRVADINYKQDKSSIQGVLSSARSVYGASGLTTEGSPMSVLLNTALQGEYSALMKKYSSLSEANALDVQAGMYREQARYTRANRFNTLLTNGFNYFSS